MNSSSTSARAKSSDCGARDDGAVRVCRLADLRPDSGVQVRIGDRAPLALWRVGDAVFATDDTCTHGKASLATEGYLQGHVIECGMHQGRFDVRDGRVLLAPCRAPLRTYRVAIHDGEVYVTIDAPA